ncbi:energy transducer TonB [Porphyrobacter sp. LM 6]|uniref:energy transducer TonB n=1 Tax=Porphyrobacter sp. LM 6 TaxID=1896196 RepID=UPI000863A0CD|nr:TonB family protein [Porphyrobacter sp. LM 6]AOL94372.1 TonB family C-terminal domain-containing protein [Porphyrobacter sp. LM 6]
MLAVPNPRPARAERLDSIDIPQAAKDEGHNGSATYIAEVGADGKLIALRLKESSMSPAIDAAVKAQAEKLYYFAATDKDGNKIVGTAEVRGAYAHYDRRSPGGGLETYTCGDLVREWDWFTAANAGRRKLFWPHNAYTSLASIEAMRSGISPDRKSMLNSRQKREKMWADLIKRCRKTPAKPMLDEVEEPDAYRRLMESF